MRRLLVLALAAGLIATPAVAGEPLLTDDASILERGVCQLEAWHRWSTNGGHEGWAVPACGVADWLELGAGVGRSRYRDTGGHTLVLVQAKSVFASDPERRWSAGVVASALRDGARESRRHGFHQSALLGLVTFNALDDRLRIHANAGVVHDYQDYTTAAWGTAAEYDFAEDWTLLGELFRDSPGRPSYQLGVRYLLVTDRVELYLSAGDRLGGEGNGWFAKFGVRFQTWKLF